MQLNKGDILAQRYKIVRYISSGGFANTYEAFDLRLEKRVAIKELFVDGVCDRDADGHTVKVGVSTNGIAFAAQKQKFKKEALRLSSCSHPNIVSVNDVFEENDTVYYAMDFIDGQSLASCAKPMPENVVRKYLNQILDALSYVHNQNILHLDIKPANVMIDGNDNVKLIDFGASKIVDDEGNFKSTTSQMAYTPGYAPLEQTNGGVNVAPYSDIYALGATLYNLLTGKNPPLVEDILSDSNALMIDGLSSSMQNVIVQSMMAAGSKRPQNVAQLKAMLSSAEATQFVPDNYYPGGSEGSSQKPSVPSQGNNKYLLGIMVLLGIIAILGIVFLAKSLIGDDANQQSESKQEVEVVTSDSDTTNVGTETYKYKETKKEKVEEEPKQAPKEESKKETKQEKEEKEKIEAPVSKAITISYKGTVGPYNVTMTLKYPDGNVVGGRVSGSYTYTKFKNKLYLNGYLTDTGILLTETTPKGNNSGDWSLMGSDLDYLYGNMSAYHDGSCNEVNLRRVK